MSAPVLGLWAWMGLGMTADYDCTSFRRVMIVRSVAHRPMSGDLGRVLVMSRTLRRQCGTEVRVVDNSSKQADLLSGPFTARHDNRER